MTFLTLIILGLCMGSSVLFSLRFGQRNEKGLYEDICASFAFIALVTVIIIAVSYAFLDKLNFLLSVPAEVWENMRGYLFIIFMGMPAVFIYNYFSAYLRAIGNSIVPFVFLTASVVLNIVMDLWFVI